MDEVHRTLVNNSEHLLFNYIQTIKTVTVYTSKLLLYL